MEETIKTLEKMDAKIFRVDPEETKAIKNAIKYLKEYQMFKTLYTARLIIDIMPEHKEAFEMAIKALEQEPTTNNDLSDCISRKFMRDLGATCIAYRNEKQKLIPIIGIDFLPSVTPQEQTFKWCTSCREYDQENHCCHRWSKVIRDAVKALEQERESKPMVAIDLYSVITQKYIEREVLDKIRAELIRSIQKGTLMIESGNEELFHIIDKYRAVK